MRTTDLDAVNWMLLSLSEQPVPSLSGALPANAALCLAALNATCTDVQTEGWAFNTETEVTLTPDASGKIAIPTNALRVVFARTSVSQPEIIERYESGQRRAYNLTDRTFVFASPVTAAIVFEFPFNELPQAARRFVKARAASKVVDALNGTREQHAYLAREEADARAAFRHDQDAVRRTPNVFDSYAAFRVIDRQYPPIGGTLAD